MALDTIKLRSPFLPGEVASTIERQLVLRQAIDGPTGEILYSLTNGTLEGSWESRLSLAVKREEWVSLPKLQGPAGRVARLRMLNGQHVSRQPVLQACEPYLEVEGSVHKLMLGHNVYGGPCDLLTTARWFTAFLAERLGVALPDGAKWLLRKVDLAEVYRLGFEAVQLYMRGMQGAEFSRRKALSYADESIMFPGQTTTPKLYHKGPEFSKHDYRRLKGQWDASELVSLQETANELLRVEVAIKAPKLDRDFGYAPKVHEVGQQYLIDLYDREVARLLREGSSMQIVRKHYEVRDRLYEVYEDRPELAGRLFGTWLQLAALGEKATKEKMKRATFYLHRQQLEAAGVSWHGSDVRIVEVATVLPADFRPVRSDPRRVIGVHPCVAELLAPYRRVA